jgi:hypothetical protein
MAETTSKEFPCRDCGTRVAWAISNNGKKYLSQEKEWVGGDYSLHSKVFHPAHRCEPNPAWRDDQAARDAARIAAAQASGQIIKGVQVEVIKGRKVPLGTVGTVFWCDETAYGMRVGFTTDSGEKFYTALSNVTIIK